MGAVLEGASTDTGMLSQCGRPVFVSVGRAAGSGTDCMPRYSLVGWFLRGAGGGVGAGRCTHIQRESVSDD